MKLGATTYSFLWTHTLEEAVKLMGDHGYNIIEFQVSPPHFVLSDYKPKKFSHIRRIMDDYGMTTLCMNIPSLDSNIASPYSEMRNMTIDLYKRVTDIALELDAQMLIIPPGKRHPLLPQPYDKCFEWARQSLCQVLEYTKDTDLIIALETVPGNFIDTVADLKKLYDAVGNKRMRILFDVTNVYMTEDSPEKKLHLVKDDLCLLHLSDTTRKKWEHTPLGYGHIDSLAFIEEAKSLGYDGVLSLEVIGPGAIDGMNRSVKSLLDLGFAFENIGNGGWNK